MESQEVQTGALPRFKRQGRQGDACTGQGAHVGSGKIIPVRPRQSRNNRLGASLETWTLRTTAECLILSDGLWWVKIPSPEGQVTWTLHYGPVPYNTLRHHGHG